MILGSKTNEHETGMIRGFVLPNKQERFLEFLTKAHNRKKFLKELNHFRWFDQRFAKPVEWKIDPHLKLLDRHLQGIQNIYRLLQSKGAGETCYVISANKNLDGKEMDLAWVLNEIVDSELGSFLSCIPGKLGLFVAEDEMLLLSR